MARGMERVLLRLALILLLSLVFAAGETCASHVSEQCGRWTVSFNWSDMEDYSKSISHTSSESGGEKIDTDTLALTSVADPARTIKINIIKYSKWNSSLANETILMNLANSTLLKSGSCKKVSLKSREIDGEAGVFGIGSECKGQKVIYAAIFPVHGSSSAAIISVLGVILSTYDQELTDLLMNSIHIG